MVGFRVFCLWLLFLLMDYAMGMCKEPTYNLIMAAVLVLSDEANKQAKFRKEIKERL